jgi:hypothetical protein
MSLRDSKGKRLKRSDTLKSDREMRLLSKLQKESLKVHGNTLNIPKEAVREEKGEVKLRGRD